VRYYEANFSQNLNSKAESNEEKEIFEKIDELYKGFKDVELEI